MWKSIVSVSIYSCIVLIALTDGNDSICKNKEKSFAILDAADDLLQRANGLFQNCSGSGANPSVCGEKIVSSTYLEVAREMISEAKKIHPICSQFLTNKPMDCSQVHRSGHNISGIYTIWPRHRLFANKSLQVYCDMDTDGGGWTVIQRRGKFPAYENFNRNWKSYSMGFGNISKGFWLGNDNIFVLSNQGEYQVRFDLQDAAKNKGHALYKKFWIEDEKSNYILHIGNYSGNAGDGMTNQNRAPFSTIDRDNDQDATPCAKNGRGGWWYKCSHTNANGHFEPGSKKTDGCIIWKPWRQLDCLAGVEIKMKRF